MSGFWPNLTSSPSMGLLVRAFERNVAIDKKILTFLGVPASSGSAVGQVFFSSYLGLN